MKGLGRMSDNAQVIRAQILRSAQEAIETERTIAIHGHESTVDGLGAAIDILQAYLDREAEENITGEHRTPQTIVETGLLAIPDTLRRDFKLLAELRNRANDAIKLSAPAAIDTIRELLDDPAWGRLAEASNFESQATGTGPIRLR